VHRLENRGNEVLEIIEAQLGSYLGEDDIVRLSGDYGRTNGAKQDNAAS
jgi:mannose-6-phosphate isomerase-like protein (cupin superfamily)